ncbi:TetR/AcrR family transcriptional regulator C-terminal domain-containing protein [Aurantimonas sp. Leaf443]|uniref:TetR/AcrR family transcriptional regulator C-terminal domain-containing protein n=1 Tax=Aurantimonas sp. Leaf443 TaxID=1736378 RepID=UPI0006F47FD1|nr:TetR/AcrR family transcriptional regulator C-terminal domain-containing protein [Aurantimonas sp. Leaf443]KQT86095.1 TetR family transcriptional regulator [Aurantimonas sp. Leaf443]
MDSGGEAAASGPTERQKEVLEAALSLLVSAGETLTMTAVARRASCSKETLYKWFGDRDGLLTATVQWQAAKVRAQPLDAGTLDRQTLHESLQAFARDWLTVLSGETSIALNRLAVGHAGTERGDLGAIVLTNGPFAMRGRLGAILAAGRLAGLVSCEDEARAVSTFFGLVVRDVQIRLLLGDPARPSAAEIERDARIATDQFFALYGALKTTPGDGR